MAPQIIKALIDAGARTGSQKLTDGARWRDRNFEEYYVVDWFKGFEQRAEQPHYDMWKVLYDYDDEVDETS